MFSRKPIYLLPRKGFFPHISVATKNKFPDTILISSNELNRQDKISFGIIPIPKMLSLTVLLEKSSDKLRWIGENECSSVQYLDQISQV